MAAVSGCAGRPHEFSISSEWDAAFNGVVSGTFRAPTVAGTLQAEDFEFTVPATSRTSEKQVQWDSLAVSIQFSRNELVARGGSLRRGETSADFDLTASLQKGHPLSNSPYTARVNLHKVDVASTAALAGFDYPVSGTADVALRSRGLARIRRHKDIFTRSMRPPMTRPLNSSTPTCGLAPMRRPLTTFI